MSQRTAFTTEPAGQKRTATQAGLHRERRKPQPQGSTWAQPQTLSRAWKNVLLAPSVSFLSILQSKADIEEVPSEGKGFEEDEGAAPAVVRRPRSSCIEDERRRPADVSQHYQFIVGLPSYEEAMRAFPKTPLLPKLSLSLSVSKRKKTLVLDLDETLCHSTSLPLERPPDIEFELLDVGGKRPVYSYKRPYVEEFLQWVSNMFEVVVFTAAQQEYGERLLSKLENTKLLEHKLYRDSCRFVKGAYVKDLNVLGRNLNEVIIIDDAVYSYSYQLDNGIPIKGWYGDDKDRALPQLIPFLMVR